MIYLDNAATTRPYPEVLDRMREVAENHYANPHAMHAFGVEAERLVTIARKTIASSLKALPQEVVFTSGGTESNNIVLYGAAALPARYGNHMLTTAIEHPAVLQPLARLEKDGFEVELLPVTSDGTLDMDAALSRIRPDTRLVSMMHVNNETGVILPVSEFFHMARRVNPGILTHVDAVQSFGKLPVIPSELGADFVSMSAHKLHGPKGVGALYVRKGARLIPTVLGGGQEGGMRSGTLNVPGICGFAKTVEVRSIKMEADREKVGCLRKQLVEGLCEAFKDQVRILTPLDQSTPYLLLVSIEKLKAEVLLHHLAERDIYVSSGSACASRKDTRSHVMKAMRVPEKWQEGILRFSLSGENCEDEIQQTVVAIREIVTRIQYK